MITLPPFKAFLASNIPSVYDNTLSYYDELTKLIGYIETVILPAINETAGEVDGIKKGLEELKSYVDNYFDNLDVQEEINNKLDDMATSGQLATIIDQFVNLGVLFAYDTLEDLKDAENLIAGCTCQTLGKETLNDGFGAYYKIDTTGDIALDNGLYATVVDDFGGNNYYDEITISTGRQYATDYYLATIPLNDSEGNLIAPYVNDETDTHTRGTLQYAQDEFTTISLNAGLGRQNSHGTWIQGAVIANGVITRHDENDIPAPDEYSYIGIKADRSLVNFSGTTQPETMLDAGVVNAFMTFGQVITDGVLTINEARQGDWSSPLVFLGTKADGTMLIMATDGRTVHDKGISATQGASMMLSFGCTNAWNLDGGGSSSLVYKGSKQNRNIDENGTKDRGIWVTLNFKKPTIDKELAKVNSYIGKERQLLNKQIRDDAGVNFCPIMPTLSFANWHTGYNIITDSSEPIVIKTEQSYTWTNNLPAFADGLFERTQTDGKYDGFIMHQTGLFKVTITAEIATANTSGWRTVELVTDDGTLAANWSKVNNVIPVSAGGESHTLNVTFLVSNSTIDTKFKLYGYGQVGDDFSRTNVVVEFMGATNS